MAPLKVLIVGGGVGGPALAFWLSRIGHEVVIVERFPALRASGAQIDLRGQGIEAVKRMGLIEAIRSKRVDEDGMTFVDSDGKARGTILANKSGQGAQSLTSEYEIMRGDLVRIFYEATKDKVQYIFGKTVDRFTQDDEKVTAQFSDGTTDTFDLLVGADGQGSRIRKDILPPDAPDPYHPLGIHMAYWFIPREESDNSLCNSYLSPGGRMILRRAHSATEANVCFFLRSDSDELRSIPRASIERQKEFWTQKFRNAGWQTDRFLAGMKTTENWFCLDLVQIKTDTWHSGRVVLLGDAAHCPSPLTGMGTTSSLIGAYVLAGEIARSTDDLSGAFRNYDDTLRPLIKEAQHVNLSAVRYAVPDSQWAISIVHFFVGIACFLRIPDLISRFSSDKDGGWKLPDYPELDPIKETATS
ncbi:uncharacterized protein N7511_003124 [Penicillium nucicola]|uniref:uncharacterized protein n=1 Tax=Penicillium nucicola TaxID=1850975 RepID=UPI0025451C2A|nr:uncharacterized protein N7511_003124 [Penicillium nucicola]KAJ5771073.1 hypothetical protein N7511_003124 [Penicillium nucicola]